MKMYDLADAYKDIQIIYPDIDAPINENINFQKTVDSPAQNLNNTHIKGNTKQFPWKWIILGVGGVLAGSWVYNEFLKNKNYISNRRRRTLKYTRSAITKTTE
jgi:hypothetical protein